MNTSKPTILGLHHVTAVTADAQANVDFYTGVLGLHLVKVTVNFDDPFTYHLYYGDATGSPGTILTFFAWPGGRRGRVGPPQVTATAYRVPAGTLPAWAERMARHGVPHAAAAGRAGEQVLSVNDPDGMRVELVDVAPPGSPTSEAGPLAVGRFHGVTLSEPAADPTVRFLIDTFAADAVAGDDVRFTVGRGGGAAVVDVVPSPAGSPGTMGVGIVHHVAWRVADDAAEAVWRDALFGAGHGVSPVMDRTYFHSIYFREPGGVLFEIATDNPGFAADEPADRLGTRLCLPLWLEPRRAEVEQHLPRLRLPDGIVIGRR